MQLIHYLVHLVYTYKVASQSIAIASFFCFYAGSPEFRLEELKQQDIRAISFMCSKTEEAETVLPRPLNGQVPVQWYFDAAKECKSAPIYKAGKISGSANRLPFRSQIARIRAMSNHSSAWK